MGLMMEEFTGEVAEMYCIETNEFAGKCKRGRIGGIRNREFRESISKK